MTALFEMAAGMAEAVWPAPRPEPAFVPEDRITVQGDEYEHIWDAPIIPGDVLGPYVHVYYCDDTDDMLTIDERGQSIDLESRRYDEIREDLDEWREEQAAGVQAVDAFEWMDQ